MPRTAKNPASTDEKILEAKEGQETPETKTEEVQETPETKKDNKTEKSVKLNFADDDDVVIISEKRAGKSITANTLNVITFDEKGKATCKGLEARYLLESNLGFKLGK